MQPRRRTRQSVATEANEIDTETSMPPSKRKRGEGTSKKPSAKKPAVSPPVTNPQLEDTNLLSVIDPSLLSQSENASSHAYQTRPSNNLHPGKQAGVEKRHQSEITAKAAEKRAEKQGRIDAKLQRQEEKMRMEKEGVAVVAALMDKHGDGEWAGNTVLDNPSELAAGPSGRRVHVQPKSVVSCSTYGPHHPYLSTDFLLSQGPTTAKEKRDQRTAQLWADIQAARTTQAAGHQHTVPTGSNIRLVIPTYVRNKLYLPTSASITPNKWLAAQSGIDNNWRRRLGAPGQSSTTFDHSPTPLVIEGPTSTGSERRTSHQIEEAIGGFHDGSVTTRKPVPNNGYREQVRIQLLSQAHTPVCL